MARILIIDDDADVRSVAKAILTSANHEVSLAENGYEALTLLDKNPYDLVISDANMPNISGYELVRRLRASHKFRNYPIALLTARREREDIERALAIGVNEYIVKPLDPVIFLRKVESLIERQGQDEPAEIIFSDGEIPADITIDVTSQILSVTEKGLVIQTNHPLVVGEKLNLSTPFFRMTLGINPPTLKISSVAESQVPGLWIVRITFVGAGDSTMQKIRTWMNQRQMKSQRKTG